MNNQPRHEHTSSHLASTMASTFLVPVYTGILRGYDLFLLNINANLCKSLSHKTHALKLALDHVVNRIVRTPLVLRHVVSNGLKRLYEDNNVKGVPPILWTNCGRCS